MSITIRNNGQGKLIYDFEGNGNDTLQILAITLGYGTPHYNNAKLAIQNNIGVPYKITEYSGTTASTLTTALQGKDVVWMAPAAAAAYWQYTNLSSAIQSFLNNGNGMIASGASTIVGELIGDVQGTAGVGNVMMGNVMMGKTDSVLMSGSDYAAEGTDAYSDTSYDFTSADAGEMDF